MQLINGVPGDQIGIADRGLLYGQSLFETIVVARNSALLLDQHLARLSKGCAALQIPLDITQLAKEIDQTVSACEPQTAVLRVSITMGEGMGEGARGYKNPVNPKPTRIVALHDYPQMNAEFWQTGITLGLANIRLSSQPILAGIKHGNRLEQIIARSEWQAGWQEALLLDQQEQVIEATQSNIFIRNGEKLFTPDLTTSGVQGVMRDYLIYQANKMNISTKVTQLTLEDIKQADEVFLSSSVIGVWPVKQFQETIYSDFSSCHTLLERLRDNAVISTI